MMRPLLALLMTAILTPARAEPAFLDWAPTPPMGWNSWDCFGTTVTGAQTRAQADYMAAKLKAHGWQYIVVDIQWYEPEAAGHGYKAGAELTMDAWGRLLPALNRFPSAAEGRGFGPLAGYVHSRGLKFGIHLMRGIPRLAVERNLPVWGTDLHARDIADTSSTCPWNPDMYGVAMDRDGAQAYYDSVFALIASWGVDYVKVDDISRPYHEHAPEIEAIRRAIDRTGRPIVLSLSPGETALSAAAHVREHANLTRISDDFWDNWPALFAQFARLENWNPHRRRGFWPDADMLPFGVLEMGRRSTRFTPDEQMTVMTLWSIARSPLMHGGDLTKTDAFTLDLLTNDEVLAVNQHSTANRPLFNRDGLVAWTAEEPSTGDRYLAVFNTRDAVPTRPEDRVFASAVINRSTPAYEVAIDVPVAGAAKLLLIVDDGGDGSGWDHANWIDPRLVLEDGSERSLVRVSWNRATAGWGQVSPTIAASGEPMRHLGRPVERGLGTHAYSLIEFDLPAGAQRFRALGALDDWTVPLPEGGTVQFCVYAVPAEHLGQAATVPVPVTLADLGIEGEVEVRDLWRHESLGTARGTFAPAIPWHGAGLYRLTTAP